MKVIPQSTHLQIVLILFLENGLFSVSLYDFRLNFRYFKVVFIPQKPEITRLNCTPAEFKITYVWNDDAEF